MTTRIYCTNEGCKGRDSCAKAKPMQDGDTPQFFVTGYYANRCAQYECTHGIWRKFASLGFQECDACHHRMPYQY
jgi:hypothetical protein